MTDIDPRRYPVGRFQPPATFTAANRTARIATLAELPQQVGELIAPLSAAQWEQRYRPGGWTVRQLVHHLADSHLHAYIRTKLALTQPKPVVCAYDEAQWAELADVAAVTPGASLQILEGVHQRWVALFEALPHGDFQKCFRHPEQGRI